MSRVIYPSDSISNGSAGVFPSTVAVLNPPDFGFLATVPKGMDAGALDRLVERYVDAYGSYCRASVGFNAQAECSSDVSSGLHSLKAVDILREMELSEPGSCVSAVSSSSSDGSCSASRDVASPGLTGSRARAMARTRSFGYKASVASRASDFPLGLCYARAFRKSARESVAYSLGFWPSLEQVLRQPAEAALPLCGTESLVMYCGTGGYHVADRGAVDVVAGVHSFNDVMVGLSRRLVNLPGTYGEHLSRVKGYHLISGESADLCGPCDLIGGESSGFSSRLSAEDRAVFGDLADQVFGRRIGGWSFVETLPGGEVRTIEVVGRGPALDRAVGVAVSGDEFVGFCILDSSGLPVGYWWPLHATNFVPRQLGFLLSDGVLSLTQ